MTIKDGYKLRYTMDDSLITTLTDSCVNGLNATANTILSNGINKTFGRYVSSTTQGFYRLNALSSNNNFTISTNYNLVSVIATNVTTWQTNILGLTTGSANGVAIGIKGTRELVISYYNGTAHLTVDTGIIVNAGKWNHYALVGANGVYKLYMNGAMVSALISPHNVGLNLSSCYVNGTYNNNSNIFGIYDDVILWESSLNDKDIYELSLEYIKRLKMTITNPDNPSQHYSLLDKTLIHLPDSSTKNMILHGIEQGKEIQLDVPFDKHRYFNDTPVANVSGKVFTHDIGIINILNIKEVR